MPELKQSPPSRTVSSAGQLRESSSRASRFRGTCRLPPFFVFFKNEQSLLRMGLAALDAVYTEMDLASIAISQHLPP